ncbi:MAG: PorT family protein [Cytophagales bacterium]|nr:PorT family protein [Cytophagales bacterium]
MKKTFLIFVLGLLSNFAFAQGIEFGVQIEPTVSFSRITEEFKGGDFTPAGSKLKFSVGPVVEINLTDNVAFSTGIFFSTRAVKYGVNVASTDDNPIEVKGDVNVDLQYVQLPTGIKFYTGKIGSMMRIYVEIGGLFDLKVAEKFDEESTFSGVNGEEDYEDLEQIEFAKFFNANVQVGLGVEFEIGSNKAYAGLNYSRGLVNVLHQDFSNYSPKESVTLNSDIVGLVMGFKF